MAKFKVGEIVDMRFQNGTYKRVVIANVSSTFGLFDISYSVYWKRDKEDEEGVFNNVRENCFRKVEK